MPPDPPELSEDVALDLEQRKYVLDLHARLAYLTYYEILGVPRNADKKTIKRTYFRLATLLHPDRYFTKKLGSYKSKMEILFARVTQAFETLSAADKRAKYDALLGNAPANARPAPLDPRMVERRRMLVEDLTKRFAANAETAKRHLETATRAKASGDIEGARDAYETALMYAPRDAAIKSALDSLQKESAPEVGAAYERQAKLEERFGHWAEAAKSWQRVVAARPDDLAARDRLAQALARAKG
jgi:curved DNA-binding protein CbpA